MIDYTNPELKLDAPVSSGKTHWRSPSNLAIIKYWGKYGRQLPQNPSISLTLQNAFSDSQLLYKPKSTTDQDIDLTFFFEDQPKEAFRIKMLKFLNSITDVFPFLKQLSLTVHSYNSFPHSAGIASSASSMSALALCLCDLENRLFATLENPHEFLRKASFVARLGSGSACRSVYPVAAVWGENDLVPESSNLYAVPYNQTIHKVFEFFHDDILIASKGEKKVSSRAGHTLMEGNIYAANRYQQARNRFADLLVAMQKGDLEHFGRIAENEALTLHALMMTSEPSYILLRPNTLKMIEMIREFREETQLPLYFSLDAGPNLHLLYPDQIVNPVQDFIQAELLSHCENKEWIKDKVGNGAHRVIKS